MTHYPELLVQLAKIAEIPTNDSCLNLEKLWETKAIQEILVPAVKGTEEQFSSDTEALAHYLNTKSALENFQFFSEAKIRGKGALRGETFATSPDGLNFLVEKEAFFKETPEKIPVFEIRYQQPNEKWTFWQAIPAEFIIMANYKWETQGVVGLYSAFEKRDKENLKNHFQIRFSGYAQKNITLETPFVRIFGDPTDESIFKVVDPKTQQILWDSLGNPNFTHEQREKSWQAFAKKYF